MGAVIVVSRSNKKLQLIKDIAQQLGAMVDDLPATFADDVLLGRMMKKEKRGKMISRKEVFKHFDL